jgi:hypothetical protein
MQLTALPVTHMSENYNASSPSYPATYNGYTTATINGIPSQQVICDDALVDTNVPSGNLTYDYSTIGGANWATTVQFGAESLKNTSGQTIDGVASNASMSLTQLQAYQTAAILDVQLASLSSPSANTITDYQYALWYLFDQNITVPAQGGTAVPVNVNQLTLLYNAAQIATSTSGANQATTAADAARLIIYTYPGGTNGSQEFLGLGTATPEPGTWTLMLGAALIALIPGVRAKLWSAGRVGKN